MDAIYDALTELTQGKEILLRGKHNYASSVVIYLRDKSQDRILDFYTNVLRKRGLDISKVYVTYFNKCSVAKLNMNSFKREVTLFGNDTIFLFHNLPVNRKKIPFDNIIEIDYDDCVANYYDEDEDKEYKREIITYLHKKTKRAFIRIFKDNK